jgi:hypothetical protein
MTATAPTTCRWLKLARPTRRRIRCGEPCQEGAIYCAAHGRKAALSWPCDGLSARGGYPTSPQRSTLTGGPRIGVEFGTGDGGATVPAASAEPAQGTSWRGTQYGSAERPPALVTGP